MKINNINNNALNFTSMGILSKTLYTLSNNDMQNASLWTFLQWILQEQLLKKKPWKAGRDRDGI